MEHILEFSLQTKIALAKINKQRGSEFNYLKPLQAKSVKSALAGDSLIVLPTGYGKSLIFELVPSITTSRAIIVSPLNAIIEEQRQRLGDCGIQINATLTSGLHNEEGRLHDYNKQENINNYSSGMFYSLSWPGLARLGPYMLITYAIVDV